MSTQTKIIGKIEPRPYKLHNKIQNYDWGTKNEGAFIPQLLGIEPQKDLPYAELWIGAHPKAPSEIEIESVIYPLDKIIEHFPIELLGRKIADQFNNQLPFLLKVLSASKALSIQSHPDKMLAQELHKKDPENYPDNNHKPEIAIAINFLDAMIGFKSFKKIKSSLLNYPELKKLVKSEIFGLLDTIETSNERDFIKRLYLEIMNSPQEKLTYVIKSIREKINLNKEKTAEEKQFLIQFENYGIDVGLISILLFNIVSLKSWEAVYNGSGTPHSYINGNIIECMANSDNVVRAGLTNKFKDINTLSEMLDYKLGDQDIIRKENNSNTFTYRTEAKEFEITLYKNSNLKEVNNNSVKVLLVIEGEIEIGWTNNKKKVTKGESYLFPALLKQFQISGNKESLFIIVSVPQ